VLRIADAADPAWRATVDGKALTPVTVDGWAQGFQLPASGGKLAVSYHESPVHLAWIAGQCFLALVVLVLALPGRRDHNDDDLPDEGDVDQQAAAEAPLPGSRRARRLAAEDPGTDAPAAPAGDLAGEAPAFAGASAFQEQPAAEPRPYEQPVQEQPVYAAYPGQQYQDPSYQDPGYAGQGYPATGYPDPAYQDPGYQDPGYQDPAYQGQPYPPYPEQPPQPYYDEQGYPVQPQPYADPQYGQQPQAPHGYDWNGGSAPAGVPGQAGAPHDAPAGAYGSLPPDDPWLQAQQPVRHPNDEAGS
jgi:hypothetical protein